MNTNTKNRLSGTIGLILLSNAALAIEALAVHQNPHSHNVQVQELGAPITGLELTHMSTDEIPNLPNAEELLKIYNIMREVSGLPDEKFAENPNIAHLKAMYLYARDFKMLADVQKMLTTREVIAIHDEKVKLRQLDNNVTSKATLSCGPDTLACAAGTSGMFLACSAGILADGTVPSFDYKCAIGLASSLASCAKAVINCDPGTAVHNPKSFPRDFTGTNNSFKKLTATCGQTGNPHENRAQGLKVKHSSNVGPDNATLVTGLQLICANGATVDYLSGGPGGSWQGGKCANGHMLQGLTLRAGSLINAATRLCDYVPDNSADIYSTLYGGNGGTFKHIDCNENEYVFGLNIWTDESLPSNRRAIHAVELICRGM